MKLEGARLREMIQEIWSTMVGLCLEAGELALDAPEQTARLSACVKISGAWNGSVVLECEPALAARVAASMLQVDECSIDETDVRDALGELANVIGGNLKALLPQPSALSLPSVTNRGARAAECTGSKKSRWIRLACGGRPLELGVFPDRV